MDVKIFAEIEAGSLKQIARVTEEGKIYAIDGDQEEYLGWIDYQENDVYDDEDYLVGWADEDGTVVLSYEDEEEDEEIGYVNDNKEIYFFNGEEQEEVYFGKIEDMKSYADGAAALLFFLEEEEEE